MNVICMLEKLLWEAVNVYQLCGSLKEHFTEVTPYCQSNRYIFDHFAEAHCQGLISKKDSSGSQLTERTGTIKTAVEPLKSSNMIVSSKSHNYKTHLIDRDSRRRAFVWAKCLFESVDGNFLIAFIEVNCRSAIVTVNGNQAEELKSYHERLKKDAVTKVKERPATGK